MQPREGALNPRVFISYSHDSPQHEERVLALANRLRQEGVDATLDVYEKNPPEGWPIWMQNQIVGADFVLLICTSNYKKRIEKNEEPGKGLGAVWEGQIVYSLLYVLQGQNDKFVPVLFSDEDLDEIPTILNSTTRYLVNSDGGYIDLYRRLTNQAAVDKPTLGPIKALLPRTKQWDSVAPAETSRIASEVVSAVTFSREFPQAVPSDIARDNFITAIKTQLTGIDLVVIEGREGIGKTTLLSQFARFFPNSAVSIFLSQDNRASYDPDLLRQTVADQLHWILNRTQRPNGVVSPAQLEEYSEQIRRFLRRKHQICYFIIDGLGEIIDQLPGGAKTILELFPSLGLDGIKFIVTGVLADIEQACPQGVLLRSFPMIEFGLEDTIRFFEGVVNDRAQVTQLQSLSGGMPGTLASVRRLITRGMEPAEIIALASDKNVTPYHIEWHKRDRHSESEKRILAQLAYDDQRYTPATLAELMGEPLSIVQNILSRLSFLDLRESDGTGGYRALWFRQEARKELKIFETSVHKKIVRRLLSEPTLEPGDAEVSSGIGDTADLKELLARLSPEHIIGILKKTQNVRQVQRAVDIGLNVARRLDRDSDMLRFGIEQSLLNELLRSGVGLVEVNALSALGLYDDAMGVARAAILKEDKLHLLAVIAKNRLRRGDQVSDEVRQQISALSRQVDLSVLGDRALEICKDLITVVPDLALDLIESVKLGSEERQNLFVGLSVIAISSLDEERSATTVGKIKERGAADQINVVQRAFGALSGKWSSEQVLSHANGLEKARDRLFVLRSWLSSTKNSAGSAAVVEHALNTAITATDYTINATVLRDLAKGLRGVTGKEDLTKLVGMFEAQLGSASKLGPSLDYVRLLVALAQAEAEFENEKAENRLIGLFYEIAQFEDVVTRAEAWAWFLFGVQEVCKVADLGSRVILLGDGLRELEESFIRLLDSTADHYRAATDVVTATAKWSVHKAVEFALMLNTETRRDRVLIDIVDSLTEQEPTEKTGSELTLVIGLFRDHDYRDEGVARAFEALSEEKVAKSVFDELSHLFPVAIAIRSAVRRTRALTSSYVMICEASGNTSESANHTLDHLRSAWSEISMGWARVDEGFSVAERLAVTSSTIAREFLDKAAAIKKELGGLSSPDVAGVYSRCIGLSIRAFAGLVRKHHATKQDVSLLASQIDVLPDSGGKARLWADLTLKCAANDDLDLAREIVTDRLAPSLAALSGNDAMHASSVVAYVFPALCVVNSTQSWRTLDELDLGFQEIACHNIISFLFRNELPSDPEDYSSGAGYDINYDRLARICDVLERVQIDWLIYDAVQKSIDCLLARRNDERLKSGQKEEIFRRLSEIVDRQLPVDRFIRHDGYKIACKAHLSRYRPNPDPNTLIKAARNIPNSADRSLVLFEVALALPKSDKGLQEPLIREAAQLARGVPMVIDRVERFIGFADSAKTVNQKLARDMLQEAVAVLPEEVDHAKQVRRIIDMAFKIDKEFAHELADKLDDDRAKTFAKRELGILELKQNVINERAVGERLKNAPSRDYGALGPLLLGSLHSGRMDTLRLSSTRACVEVAGRHPLSESFFVLAWIIENAVDKYSNTDRAGVYLRPIYEGVLSASEMSLQLADEISVHQRASLSITVPNTKTDSTERLNREHFLGVLCSWLGENRCDELVICDESFSREDLGFVRLVRASGTVRRLKVVTNKKSQTPVPDGEDLETAYTTYWNDQVSDQSPPSARIVMLGADPDGAFPIKNTLILCETAGLELGNTIRGFGTERVDEIRRMGNAEVNELLEKIDDYLSGRITEVDGNRLRCSSFTM